MTLKTIVWSKMNRIYIMIYLEQKELILSDNDNNLFCKLVRKDNKENINKLQIEC